MDMTMEMGLFGAPSNELADIGAVLREGLAERYAEREAVEAVAGVTFTDCVRLAAMPDAIHDERDASGKRSKNAIRAQDVFVALKKYVREQAEGRLKKCRLTGIAEPLSSEFVRWLTTSYTPRYRGLMDIGDHEWLRCVALLAIKRHIMETKWHNVRKGNTYAFADQLAYRRMYQIMLVNQAMQAGARGAIHASRGEMDYAREMLEAMSRTMRQALNDWRDDTSEPLPPLPPAGQQFSLPEPTSDEGKASA